ncbi:CLUMA_CG016894, isoform A [Clunio marinus]|uniref:CLUMA_CG016894, isoform A n=1 Tax=Clunio marinus TaxID=568069 RepID=A0A1J1ISD9_9DIPT|nr:CLUMA_CG016894, isoform A [Clunio marinus]
MFYAVDCGIVFSLCTAILLSVIISELLYWSRLFQTQPVKKKKEMFLKDIFVQSYVVPLLCRKRSSSEDGDGRKLS